MAISEQILIAAGGLFYKEGIRVVGIDRIIEEANVAKATLYRHFPSKDHLVEAYLRQRHERVIKSFEEVTSNIVSPRDQVATIFGNLFQKAESPEFRGCAFALAVAEHGDSERVVSIARHHKSALRALFKMIMSRAGSKSELAAVNLAMLYEGALATVAVDRNPNAVLVARDCALTVFDWLVLNEGLKRDTAE